MALLIDGSVLEGGGQLLRNSISLAALLSKPITIHNIRHARTPSGLKNQHLSGLELAAEICSATLTGALIGSCVVEFRPGPFCAPGDYSANPGTAGSTTLLLQISLPCLIFSPVQKPSVLTLRGGTNAIQAPQVDHTQHVLFPFLRRHFGLDLLLDIRKRGYYPKGGGIITCSISPTVGPLPAVTLTERGAVTSVEGRAFVGNLPLRIAREMVAAAKGKLVATGMSPDIIDIMPLSETGDRVEGHGSGIVLWAKTEGGCILGGSAVGKKGLAATAVGEAAARELLGNLDHGGCVDEFMQDQIIIFMTLAQGESVIKTGPLTLHTKTAIWVVEKLTNAMFEIEETPSGQCTIRCRGIGMKVTQ